MPTVEMVRDDVVGGYTLRGHCPICGESFDSTGIYGRTGHDKVAADFANYIEEKHRREDFKGNNRKVSCCSVIGFERATLLAQHHGGLTIFRP